MSGRHIATSLIATSMTCNDDFWVEGDRLYDRKEFHPYTSEPRPPVIARTGHYCENGAGCRCRCHTPQSPDLGTTEPKAKD